MTAVTDGRDQPVQCNLVANLIIAEIGGWKIVSQILYLRIWKLMRRHHGSYLDVGLLMRGTHLGESCGNGDEKYEYTPQIQSSLEISSFKFNATES
jgi:hypothetical protein